MSPILVEKLIIVLVEISHNRKGRYSLTVDIFAELSL